MKNQLKSLIAGFMLASLSITASAELIETDWKSDSDGLATLDTQTGLEWLDLTQTDNLSYDQVTSELNTTFSGWRMPTLDEISSLYNNAIGAGSSSQTVNVYSYDSLFEQTEEFASLFGTTGSDSSASYHYGLYYDDVNSELNMFGLARVHLNNPSGRRNIVYTTLYSGTFNTYEGQSSMGVFLVSDGGTTKSSQDNPGINSIGYDPSFTAASVPEPSSLMLMGLSVFGFGLYKRKNNKV